MNKKTTVTIGIPVYNEEKNITNLMHSLLGQVSKSYKLNKIIISSDGSTDLTVNNLLKIKSKKLVLIDNNKRCGISRGLNQITNRSNTDILVILNGDISILDNLFIEKLIKPIINQNIDLTSCKVNENTPSTFTEKIIDTGSKYRWHVFEKYKNGNNLYTCRGVARAFSKKLYQSITFNQSIGEDMYTYFYAIKNGFKYKYVKNTYVCYKVPSTLLDHKNQSIRYLKSIENMKIDFGVNFVKENLNWPIGLLFKEGCKAFFKDPVHAFLYPFIYLGMKVVFMVKPKVNNLWEIATSSK